MGKKIKDSYGNITYGEATALLVEIIGQIVILSRIPDKDKREAFKSSLERMCRGEGVYSKFATAAEGSAQWYFADLFKNFLELPSIAMILIDSFTWQFFHALTCTTPFETLKKDIALMLAKKLIFNIIYHNLLNDIPLSDGKIYNIKKESIKFLLTDRNKLIFDDINEEFKKENKIFIDELKQYLKENLPKNKPINIKNKIYNELINNDLYLNEIKDTFGDYPDDIKYKLPKVYNLLGAVKNDDNYQEIFLEAIEQHLNFELGKPESIDSIINEIPESEIKYPYLYEYINSNNKDFNEYISSKEKDSQNNDFYYNDNINDWCKDDNINPRWETLEPILDFLFKNDKHSFAHRLIGLYFLKNTKEAFEKHLGISEKEQKEIINDIFTMLDDERKNPENFYNENIYKSMEHMHLINMCLEYHLINAPDKDISENIHYEIEKKCVNSKKFFSPWLRARKLIFEKGNSLKENKEDQEKILKGYKTALKEGAAYAGEYLGQFLLEAITINIFFNPEKKNNKNDSYYGYGYALEMFGENKQELYNLISDVIDIKERLSRIHFSDLSGRWKKIRQDYPNLELINNAKEINDMGLEFKKFGDIGKAKKNYFAAMVLYPLYTNSYINLGEAYSIEENFKNALFYYDMALLLDPNHLYTLFNRALLFAKNKQYEDAIKDFTSVIKLNYNDYEAYLYRSKCFNEIKQFELAKNDYIKAREIIAALKAHDLSRS